jgi:hypothetical protein
MSLVQRYRWSMLIGFAGLALMLVGANAKAEAADCMSFSACNAQASAQRADSQQRHNEAVFYRAAAWSSGAKGDSGAAAMYNAAADQKQNESDLLAIAAANSDNRARFFFAATFDSPAPAGEALADSQAAGDGADTSGEASIARVREYCKNAANKDYSEFGIHILVRPGTWCHKGSEVTRVDYSASNDVTGPQALDVIPSGCDPVEREFYNWKGHGPKSGRKLIQNCNFKSIPPVSTMHCSVSLYFHSDGSRYYQQKMHCHVSFL